MMRRNPISSFAATCLLILVVIISAIAPATAQEIDPRDFETRASEIHGFIRMRGCVPDATRIAVNALPLSVRTTGRWSAALDPRADHIRADVTATSDPHVVAFRIRGLHPITLYQLSVFTPPSPVCGRVFWRHDYQGRVVSGGEPVMIEGIAATTSVEVLQPATDQWVGAEPLDITNRATAARRLRWRSLVPGVLSGELQFSTAAFPNRGEFSACDEPDGGVFHRQTVPAAAGDWNDIPLINFNDVIERRVSTRAIAPSTYRALLLGAPIYARVLPNTATGRVCDSNEQGVPGWVVFARVPSTDLDLPEPTPGEPVLEPGGPHVYRPPYFHRPSAYQPDTIFPTYSDTGYRVVKPHTLPTWAECQPNYTIELKKKGISSFEAPAFKDPLGCSLVRAQPYLYQGATLNIGFRFVIQRTYSSDGGGSFLDIAGSLITGTVNAFGVGVNFLADVYNGAVDAAKELAYDFILTTPGLGQLCDAHPDECRKGVEIGVSHGLMAMGLPPSLPNWDQLKGEGIDYLAGVIGDQLEEETGVPSGVTALVLKELATRVVIDLSNKRGGSDPTVDWVVGDLGFEPPSWLITVKKTTTVPLPLDMALLTQENPLFGQKVASLPRRFPPSVLPGVVSSFLRVPMVLPPNYDGIPAPVCRSSYPPYTHPDPPQTCFPAFPPTATPRCEYQSKLYGPSSPWFEDEGCELLQEMVTKYYRDAWAARVEQTPCVAINAIALAKGPGFFQFSAVPGYSFFVGALVPPMMGGTWSGPFINACQ
jgi:hypothetical protein